MKLAPIGTSKEDTKKALGDVEDAEGLALLIPDIQRTSRIVSVASRRLQLQTSSFASRGRTVVLLMGYHCAISHCFTTENAGSDKLQGEAEATSKDDVSLEEKYMRIMQKLQFGEYPTVMFKAIETTLLMSMMRSLQTRSRW